MLFFENVSSDALGYVPVGSKAAYETTEGWEELIIKESDFSDVALPSDSYVVRAGNGKGTLVIVL